MRWIALWVLGLTVGAGSIATAETLVRANETYVCSKCGKVHVRKTPQPSATVVTGGSVAQNAAIGMRPSGGVSNVMAALNAQRARQGVPSLRYDPQLQAVAQRRAQQMAASGLKNHPPGSFAPGTHEGVGWSSSYAPSGVSACYTSDSRMTCAGAAMATGRDGVYFAVVYR